MSGSTKASVERKETKVNIAFDKIARITEELRLCRNRATQIKSKLYGSTPEDSAKSEEATKNPVFFDRLSDELLTLQNIASGLKISLDEINENL